MSDAPVPGPFRPGPRPGPPRPMPPPAVSTPSEADAAPGGGTGHPAVDAAIRGLDNAVGLSLRDQIAEYEAAHRTLQETLATIDQV